MAVIPFEFLAAYVMISHINVSDLPVKDKTRQRLSAQPLSGRT